jgi:hypothetical protein
MQVTSNQHDAVYLQFSSANILEAANQAAGVRSFTRIIVLSMTFAVISDVYNELAELQSGFHVDCLR